ncbi:1,2-phenylacetyl-CoA epoxidase, subunit E [bacterium HR21]|nr:1,2-phenylacetyl-CoA epoxidase, subunit E [bacterium HR21]
MAEQHSLLPGDELGKTAEPSPVGEVEVVVRLYGEEHSFRMRPNEYILYAAVEAGLDAPHSCLSGYCATCRAKLVEGRVRMEINDALTEEEVAQGYILTCQSLPLTARIVVDYDQ